MTHRIFIAVVFLIPILGIDRLVPPPCSYGAVFDPRAFEKLSQSDRLAVFLSGLRSHAAALSNAELEVSLTVENTVSKGKFRTDSKICFRTIGDRLFFSDDKTVRAADGSGKTIKHKNKTAWDGVVTKRWTLIEGNKHPSGTVADSQSAAYETISPEAGEFLKHLGIWQRLLPSLQTVADSIAVVTGKEDFKYEVQSVESLGNVSLRLAFWDSHQHRYEYEVDPQRDFVIMRNSIFDSRGKSIDTVTNDVKEIDGVWLPTRVTRSLSFPAASATMSYEVTNASFGKVVDADLTFAFEPGTLVSDPRKDVVVRVEQDGSTRELPTVNPATGKVTGMPPRPLNKVTPTPTATLGELGATPRTTLPNRPWLVLSGLVLGITGLVAAAIVLKRGKPTLSRSTS